MLTFQCHALQLKLIEMVSISVKFFEYGIDLALQNSLRDVSHIPRLKEEQKLCLRYWQKRDVFGIIWTGFGTTNSKRLILKSFDCFILYLKRCRN